MLLSLIFPPTCFACGRLGCSLCSSCLKKLEPTTEPSCISCGERVSPKEMLCPNNKLHEQHINISFWAYNHTLTRIISSVKYHRNTHCLFEVFPLCHPQTIANIRHLCGHINNPILVPIPLHSEREKERGFNQAALIAYSISALCNVPVVKPNVLVRIRKTRQQAKTPSRRDRIQNVQNVFHCEEPEFIKNTTPIIIDDVITTGSTIRSAARALGLCGDKPSYSICLAHDEPF